MIQRGMSVVYVSPVVEAIANMNEDEIINEAFSSKQELCTLRATPAVGGQAETSLFRKHRERFAQLIMVKKKKEVERAISKRE